MATKQLSKHFQITGRQIKTFCESVDPDSMAQSCIIAILKSRMRTAEQKRKRTRFLQLTKVNFIDVELRAN